jgi:bacterioferritin
MASQKLIELLNKGVSRELQVSLQYMWDHVRIISMAADTVGDVFRKIAIEEMKHAEQISERIDYLGGVPTTDVDPVVIGKTPVEMIELGKKAEEEALVLYKATIKQAVEEGDVVTRHLFEDILEDEEEHHHVFTHLLKK